MRHDAQIVDRAAALNAGVDGHDAAGAIRHVLGDDTIGPVALVSSFGADSAVLLHLVAGIDPDLPVIFVDTGKHFAETIDHQRALTRRLGLRDVRRQMPAEGRVARADPDGTLHETDPDGCCALRKTAPLNAALKGFDAWISGRKRHQSDTRTALEMFEVENFRLKINPLAHWGADDLSAYAAEHDLPPHPLVAHGYGSIGCAPCTGPVAEDEDPRAGRWRGKAKTECGIHVASGYSAPCPRSRMSRR